MALAGHPLACYVDADGRTRELLTRPGCSGSVLVLDRDALTLCDRRLVAHLAADEPPENAELVCRLYLEDPNGRWCRHMQPQDLETPPVTSLHADMRMDNSWSRRDWRADGPGFAGEQCTHDMGSEAQVVTRRGEAYRLGLLPGERAGLQLRWTRRVPEGVWVKVGLRDVVASLESYEPVRTLTQRALARGLRERDPSVSFARLQAELERLNSSPIVLNRCLREAVLEAIRTRELSMSEIALRCGMVKYDNRGKPSGETSWLARRVGIMPQGGERAATPWIHSDVLGLIARRGLGVSPREVEL